MQRDFYPVVLPTCGLGIFWVQLIFGALNDSVISRQQTKMSNHLFIDCKNIIKTGFYYKNETSHSPVISLIWCFEKGKLLQEFGGHGGQKQEEDGGCHERASVADLHQGLEKVQTILENKIWDYKSQKKGNWWLWLPIHQCLSSGKHWVR